MKYAIWLIPPEPLLSKLSSIVNHLSTEYDSPKFIPHISVLTNIETDLTEVEEKSRELAKRQDLDLTLGSSSFSSTYFQSVFVRVNSTAKLMQLNIDAKNMFDKENDVFMPHISLMYGGSMEIREKVVEKIELPKTSFICRELAVTPNYDKVDDIYNGDPLAIIPFEF